MGLSRNTLLWASRNKWLKQRIPKMKFVQNAVKQFLPGETEHDAIAAARNLLKQNIATTFTYLGENISSLKEAEDNKEKYINLLEKINKERLDTEISLKLTQFGFDQSFDKTFSNIKVIIERAKNFRNSVFIDIEDSSYVNKTIEIYEKIKGHRSDFLTDGLCFFCINSLYILEDTQISSSSKVFFILTALIFSKSLIPIAFTAISKASSSFSAMIGILALSVKVDVIAFLYVAL